MTKRALRILLAQPRGFCAGVERAIEIVERALARFGPPVYVRHEIVHNRHVVDALRAKGAVFVDEVDQIPEGAATVFSAHGVATAVEQAGAARRLAVIDAACPLVTKVHNQGRRYAERGYEIILIGHAGHPEVEGTLGRIPGPVHLIATVEDVPNLAPSDPAKLAYVTQTTLSVDDTRAVIEALRARFPAIVGPDTRDICYATQNRQTAVRALAQAAELILVIGAAYSSNSNRLREIAESAGARSYLIESVTALEPAWLDEVGSVGITAGASAPEFLVAELVEWLSARFDATVEALPGIEETIHFHLPPQLADDRCAPPN